MSSPSRSQIDQLIALLAKLPGLGPRSARRVALHLIKKRDSMMRPLADALHQAADRVVTCGVCNTLDMTDPCGICHDERRDRSVICVVEEVGDVWALQRAGAFDGLYHVLGGVLSAMDGVRPEDLSIQPLLSRARNGETREIILALNATVDGAATAHYINDRLRGLDVTVSSIARGVPVGGELDYLDDGTLSAAVASRRPA
jgi:recombination protein RecR